MGRNVDNAGHQNFWESETYQDFYLQNVLSPAIAQRNRLPTRMQFLFFGRKIIPFLYLVNFCRGSILPHSYDFEKGFILAVRKFGSSKIRVIDFGGGGGDNYFNLRLFVKKKIKFDWILVDNPLLIHGTKILRESSKWANDRILLQNENIGDMLILNGTLQYLDSNTSAINLRQLQRFILLNRTVFSNENKTVQQKIVLPGANERISLVSNRVLNEESLCREFIDLGYSVCWRGGKRKYDLETKDGIQAGYYRTILFEVIKK